MIKDKILNLINLCLEVQEGEGGVIEPRTSKKPVLFLTMIKPDLQFFSNFQDILAI